MKKRIFSTLLALATVFTIPFTAYADESKCKLYADESTINDMRSNFYGENADYNFFVFNSTQVTYDFEKVMPLYALDYSKSPEATAVADMLVFADYYIVPAYNGDNELYFAEFEKIPTLESGADKLDYFLSLGDEKTYNMLLEQYTNHSGEWELIGSGYGGQDKEFYDFICSDDPVYKEIMSCEQAYLTNDNYGYNILMISEGQERNFRFYDYINDNFEYSLEDDNITPNYFISGSELLETARKEYNEFLNSPENSAGSTGEDDDFEDISDEILAYPDEEAINNEPKIEETNNAQSAESNTPNPHTGNPGVAVLITVIATTSLCIIGAKKS